MQRDYLMRLIAVFTQALMSSLGLVRRERYDEALILIERALQELLGSDVEQPGSSNADAMPLLPLSERVIEPPTKALMAARLFREAGLIHDHQGRRDVAAACHFRCLELLLEGLLAETLEPTPDFAPTLPESLAALEAYDLPGRHRHLLIRYYERAEAYDKAEDTLFRLLDAGEGPSALASGVAFYERLLRLPPEQLAAGGLPRDEVLAGLAELRRHSGVSK